MSSFTPVVKRILRSYNCHPVRSGKGDHEIWHSPITNRHFPVDSKILSRHTANAIMKQAGIVHKF
ncbi:MAG: type II toxin-antitoxin system HicA family toxin [Rhizomicrobium sp.]